MRIAIVGLGPWGLCAMERVITTARAGLPAGLKLELHIVEPGLPGSGVYDVRQPDYLILNNPCGQLSLCPYKFDGPEPRYALGLYEWALQQGYRWADGRCAPGREGEPVSSHDFLPRRLMGLYLNWFYEALVEEAPATVTIEHHATRAVDLIERADGTELVCLENGEWLRVDHVIVTSGHTANADPAESVPHLRQLTAYPVDSYNGRIPAGAKVGVAGFGLVAVDVVTALTTGVGGSYVEAGNGRLRYVPSGLEPVLHLFCRSGLPFTAKSVTGIDRTDVYEPIIGTPRTFLALTTSQNGSRRQADVRRELLPLLFAEMYARYYAQVAYRQHGLSESTAVRERLRAGWFALQFESVVEALAERYGPYSAEEQFFGPNMRYDNSEAYEHAVYQLLDQDLVEADVDGGYSPSKSASEVFRIFRDPMRSVVEHGGLSLDSYLDFNTDIRSRINRLVAGPPALRSRQFLALMDAGILRIPFGPAPAIGPGKGSGAVGSSAVQLSSTLLGNGYAEDLDVVIRGHLEEPRIDGSASTLLNRLYDEGRISQFRYGSVTVGSVDLTRDSHPIGLDGRPHKRIWMFGVLTEGVRHFTHYLPSPNSRMRAFEDIGACVAEILQQAPGSGKG